MHEFPQAASFINNVTRLIYTRKKITQILIGAITIAFAIQLFDLRVNSSPYFMAQEHESRIHELDIKRLFSNSGEQILVVVRPSSGDPLGLPSVNAVSALTNSFEALSLKDKVNEDLLDSLRVSPEAAILIDRLNSEIGGQRAPVLRELEVLLSTSETPQAIKSNLARLQYLLFPIKKVRSLSTIENLTSTEEEIDLHPLLPEGELGSDEMAQFKSEALDNPLFRGLLLSDDLKATSIQIELKIPKDDNRNTGYVYDQIVEIVNSFKFDGELFLAGNPVVEAEMSKSMQRDNLVFFPFVMLVISVILFVCFRQVSGIYVPLTIAGVTTIWTLGIMVLLGIEQNIVTTILPVFLLTVAVADAIHFYNHYLNSDNDADAHLARLQSTFSQLLRPLLLTSITTLIGFLALAWTDIIFIREFGLFMGLGVVIAFVLTLLIAPVLIPESSITKESSSQLNSFLLDCIETVLNRPFKVLLIFAALTVASIVSLPSLEFDQENVNNFDPSTVLRSHHTEINKHFDGTNSIDIWIDTGKQGGIYNPQVIRDIEALEQYLETREGIGFVLTPVDFLKRMYDLLTFEGHILPEGFDEQLIAQEILIYENESSQDIKNVIDDQHRHLRLIVLGESDAASFWGPILADIEAMAPTGTVLEINGYGKVMFSNIEEVITTNITSTIIALSLISLTMFVLFRSVPMGFIGVLPLILTVTMNYAAMSVAGIAVDVGTTIIASIAFGIGIDYSIHYLSAIERTRADMGDNSSEAILEASKKVALPIAVNSLTLAGGFLVLTASNFLVIELLGLFIAMCMLISAINALILVPTLSYLLLNQSPKSLGDLADAE